MLYLGTGGLHAGQGRGQEEDIVLMQGSLREDWEGRKLKGGEMGAWPTALTTDDLLGLSLPGPVSACPVGTVGTGLQASLGGASLPAGLRSE